jgi:hypothetical protein
MAARYLVVITALASGVAIAQTQSMAPDALPAAATTQLAQSLEAAGAHCLHLWRDTPPRNTDGTVNAYVEISRGDRRKWELDMRANARAIDRVMPESVGGYPVNHGFVPQTVSYDGDPFDALVLGPRSTAANRSEIRRKTKGSGTNRSTIARGRLRRE